MPHDEAARPGELTTACPRAWAEPDMTLAELRPVAAGQPRPGSQYMATLLTVASHLTHSRDSRE